jgi:hypothetical protein
MESELVVAVLVLDRSEEKRVTGASLVAGRYEKAFHSSMHRISRNGPLTL